MCLGRAPILPATSRGAMSQMSAQPDLDALKARAATAVDEAAADLRRLSLDIHAHPELNFEEAHAHDLLTAAAAAAGFAVEAGAFDLPTAFRASAGEAGPVIAICCEYDALPEIGHACGHNLIAAAGLGAGIGARAANLEWRAALPCGCAVVATRTPLRGRSPERGSREYNRHSRCRAVAG